MKVKIAKSIGLGYDRTKHEHRNDALKSFLVNRKQVLQNILFKGSRYSYEVDNPILNIGIMFDFLKDSQNTVVIANRSFETKLYNLFISEEEVSSSMYHAAVMEKNQFVEAGMLQMDKVLQKFQEHFTDIYADSSAQSTKWWI